MTKSHTDAVLKELVADLHYIAERGPDYAIRGLVEAECDDLTAAFLRGIRAAAWVVQANYIGQPRQQSKPSVVLAFDSTRKKNPGGASTPPGE